MGSRKSHTKGQPKAASSDQPTKPGKVLVEPARPRISKTVRTAATIKGAPGKRARAGKKGSPPKAAQPEATASNIVALSGPQGTAQASPPQRKALPNGHQATILLFTGVQIVRPAAASVVQST